MNNILKVINDITTDQIVKSIINSVNDNQEKSKNWLVDKSKDYLSLLNNPKICIAAGWYGHLADKLRPFTNEKVLSFDKDSNTKLVGSKLYNDVWFKVETIESFESFEKFNVLVCTSCEHLEQKVIDDMLEKTKKGTLIILQSNNYFEIEDHINCHNTIDKFLKTIKLDKILFSGTLSLQKYNRFMVIGIK